MSFVHPLHLPRSLYFSSKDNSMSSQLNLYTWFSSIPGETRLLYLRFARTPGDSGLCAVCKDTRRTQFMQPLTCEGLTKNLFLLQPIGFSYGGAVATVGLWLARQLNRDCWACVFQELADRSFICTVGHMGDHKNFSLR